MQDEKDHYIKANTNAANGQTKILKQGDSFGIFDFSGDIHQIGRDTQGLYHKGTRFLSEWDFLIENQHPLFLSSDTTKNNEILSIDLNNPTYPGPEGEKIEKGKLHILRNKFLHAGVAYEKMTLHNYSLTPLDVDLKMKFRTDFADIFEVRGEKRPKKGNLRRAKCSQKEMVLSYMGLDKIERVTRIRFNPKPQVLFENDMQHNVCLQPGESFEMVIAVACEIGKNKPEILGFQDALDEREAYNADIKKNFGHIYTSNERFNDWLNNAKADLVTMTTETDYGPFPYAGIPWFNAPFGRDSILTAMECLWLEPNIAKGCLKFHAAHQATEKNDERDAQPGKILHEKREGEMANLNEVPFGSYYGTVDATPLFVCLAGMYFTRTGDRETIAEIWPNIERAIEWMDTYGDFDNDGFLEYRKMSSEGLSNQGWKDSDDAVFYENGTVAEGAIALCEVQGYAYLAKKQAAHLAALLGHDDKSARWQAEAEKLKTDFNANFWSDDKNTFTLAMDGNKRKCDIITSNAGQCLFTGIVDRPRAAKVAETLTADDMFSGWGIRTLSSKEIRYNPMSYHNGSIWPHDNAFIAYGFSKCGLHGEANKVLTTMFEASNYEEDHRLPELFCGFERRSGRGPTAYPVACSPQAWAVGAVFLMVQALLGLEVNGQKMQLIFRNPQLPDFLNKLRVSNMALGDVSDLTFEVYKTDGGIDVKILKPESGVELKVINS